MPISHSWDQFAGCKLYIWKIEWQQLKSVSRYYLVTAILDWKNFHWLQARSQMSVVQKTYTIHKKFVAWPCKWEVPYKITAALLHGSWLICLGILSPNTRSNSQTPKQEQVCNRREVDMETSRVCQKYAGARASQECLPRY